LSWCAAPKAQALTQIKFDLSWDERPESLPDWRTCGISICAKMASCRLAFKPCGVPSRHGLY
jgi:hypothetical protein